MNPILVIAGVAVVALFLYLGTALLKPEWFQ